MIKKEEEKKAAKKSDQTAKLEEDAAKFEPASTGCGALIKAKKRIEHLMRLKDIQSSELAEGEVVIVLCDFVHTETDERALILLLPDEQRHMYMTTEFDEDFEILHEGTQSMVIGGKKPISPKNTSDGFVQEDEEQYNAKNAFDKQK